MKQAHATSAGLAPWHLWLVGLLLLAWNALGCYSHVMTLSRNADYFRGTGVTPEIAAYFAALPAWYVATWTIGVWGGLVAAAGLLMRKSWTVSWFAASQLAMAVNSVATLLNANALEVMGSVRSIMAYGVITIGVFVVLYSMVMKRSGVLR